MFICIYIETVSEYTVTVSYIGWYCSLLCICSKDEKIFGPCNIKLLPIASIAQCRKAARGRHLYTSLSQESGVVIFQGLNQAACLLILNICSWHCFVGKHVVITWPISSKTMQKIGKQSAQ